jgi:hypothetical protein
MWVEAEFPPATFWQQTERSFVLALEARAEAMKRRTERERRLAWNIAALSALASVGKLKSFDESFVTGEDGATGGSAKVLGLLFRLKRKGVPMTIEKITLH